MRLPSGLGTFFLALCCGHIASVYSFNERRRNSCCCTIDTAMKGNDDQVETGDSTASGVEWLFLEHTDFVQLEIEMTPWC